jgi:hypothetical protein
MARLVEARADVTIDAQHAVFEQCTRTLLKLACHLFGVGP